jgi:predicted CoA-binding protein
MIHKKKKTKKATSEQRSGYRVTRSPTPKNYRVQVLLPNPLYTQSIVVKMKKISVVSLRRKRQKTSVLKDVHPCRGM